LKKVEGIEYIKVRGEEREVYRIRFGARGCLYISVLWKDNEVIDVEWSYCDDCIVSFFW